jgi:hypothetical protein
MGLGPRLWSKNMREMGSGLVDPVADLAVREIHQRAGLDPSRAVGAVRIAVELFGERCICLAPPRELPGPSALVWAGPEPVIHVRRGLNARQLNHAVAHELGEWQLHLWGYHGPEAEELAGRIGAALCVPDGVDHAASDSDAGRRLGLADYERRLARARGWSRCRGIDQGTDW